MRLIINGDDFGITHACNLALIDCFQKGVMTSTSLMTNMPAAKEAAELWQDNPGLSVGIHFCLTAGKPLTEASTLTKEDGTFDKAILHQKGRVSQDEIRKELQAQFDKFIELTGRMPDHLNSHHGIEQIEGGGEVIQEFSRRYNIPMRPFINREEWSEYEIPFEIAQERFIENSDPNAPTTPQDYIGLFTFEDLQSNRSYELAAHPGYVDFELLQLSSLTTGRTYEAHNYMSDELKNWIQDNQIELINYTHLNHKV